MIDLAHEEVHCGFGTFQAGDIGDGRDQPNDFVVPPLWLVGAMHELRLVSARQIDLKLEFDCLAGEALAEIGIEGRPGFFAHYLEDAFTDHLLGRKATPFRIMPVDELVAGLPVAVREGDPDVVGDKAQLALAVAQQIGALSKLRH